MATYKVPQDVEAEDKLIGPFSFRQFIYLIVAALGIGLGVFLFNLSAFLIVIPAPIVVFFLILALPLKKDQPMETYLAAIVRFLLKPRIRLWDPEGQAVLVDITATQVLGPVLKDYSETEATERLRYLARVVDTGGWSTRGLTSASDDLRFNTDVISEAATATDMLDTSTDIAQSLETLITRSDTVRKQTMMQSVQDTLHSTPVTASSPALVPPEPTSTATQQTLPTSPIGYAVDPPHVTYNPYPSSIHQRVIESTPRTATQPMPTPQSAKAPQPQASSEEPVSPDIMRLANNNDLSISTIAREAERIQKQHLDNEEVVVSLR